jgi:regulator of sigma E protease
VVEPSLKQFFLFLPVGIITIMILGTIHEFGHFFFARLFHIKVDEFVIGFGRDLYKKTTKSGLIIRVKILPIMGYVKIHGMEGNKEEDSFFNQPYHAKFLSILGGPLFNFLFAIILFALIFAIMGNPFNAMTVVTKVQPNSPAAVAGIQPGDQIVTVNNKPVQTANDIADAIGSTSNDTIPITVKRGNREVNLVIKVPKKQGSSLGMHFKLMKENVVQAVKHGTSLVSELSYKTFKILFTTTKGLTETVGPVGLLALMAVYAQYGYIWFFVIVAFVSLALGLTNILPIPPLDGSWLVIFTIEKLRKKKIPFEKIEKVQATMLYVLFAYIGILTVKDIIMLIKQ